MFDTQESWVRTDLSEKNSSGVIISCNIGIKKLKTITK
jgi:hypothetical protein